MFFIRMERQSIILRLLSCRRAVRFGGILTLITQIIISSKLVLLKYVAFAKILTVTHLNSCALAAHLRRVQQEYVGPHTARHNWCFHNRCICRTFP